MEDLIKKIYISTVLFLLVALSPAFSFAQEMSAIEATSLFYEAGLEYKDGNYEKAINIYESILGQNKESGSLYYNLGNSYFKSENLGKAILCYEKALRFMPRDSDLKANHRYSVKRVKSYLKRNKDFILTKFLRNITKQFTANELTVILFILGVLGSVVFMGCLFLKIRRKQTISVLTTLGILFAAIVLLLSFQIRDQGNAAIVLSETEAKFEPLEEATDHFITPVGLKVKIIKEETGWVKIKRLDGKVGWIKSSDAERI